MYDYCQMEKPAKWFDLRFTSDEEMETTAGEKQEGTLINLRDYGSRES